MSTLLIALAIAGVVMFIIFFVFLVGGTNRMKASRVVSQRGFAAEVPVLADGVVRFLLPRGFVLHPPRPPLKDWRDEFRVTWRASLGSFSSKLGSGSSGELRISAAVAGTDPHRARPFLQDWRLDAERDGLIWFTGRPPTHTSSIGAWSPKGIAVTLWSEGAYDREQARTIVKGVLDSIEFQGSAWRAACEQIRVNASHGVGNREAFGKILSEKFAPLPDREGEISEAPKGRGYVVRHADGSPGIVAVLGSIPLAAGEDPLYRVKSIEIDRGRVHRGLAVSWDEIDGAADAGVLALWIDAGGEKIRLFDLQRQQPVPWEAQAEDLPEAEALRRAAKPGKLVLIRHWNSGGPDKIPAWQFELWVDGSLAVAESAKDGGPIWMPKSPGSK